MSRTKSNIKLRKAEHQLIHLMMDVLGKIDQRHKGKLSEVEYEDLSERISALITDLSWLTDYSENLEDPEFTTHVHSDGHDEFVRRQNEATVNEWIHKGADNE